MEKLDSGGLRTAFDPTGTLLASNGWEGRLRLWEPILGRQVLNLTGYEYPEFSQDGRIFLRRGNEVSTWRVDPALEYRTLAHGTGPPLNYGQPSIHHDGRLLAVGTDRGVVIWDLARGTELAFLPIGMAWHSMFDVSGDLLTNGSGGVLRWPVRVDSTGGDIRIGPPRRLPLSGTDCPIAEDRTGQIIAVAGYHAAYVALADRTITVGPLDDCRGVSVSPDGQWLATSSHSLDHVRLWHLPEGARATELPSASGAYFSPDGRWLITSETSCRQWEVGSWREVRQIECRMLCYSPDGRLLVVEDTSKLLRLVELESGRILARLESPDQHNASWATFSPDGSRLVVTSNDPPCAHVWNLRAIRRRLGEMGLDWEAPPLGEQEPASPDLPPLSRLKIDYGPLAGHLEQSTELPAVLFERYSARIKKNPGDGEAYHQRGHAQIKLNHLAEAIDDLTQAIRLRPTDAHLRHLRGQVYARGLSKLEPAIADLEAAVSLDPSHPDARSLLAECCNNQSWLLVMGHPSHQALDRAGSSACGRWNWRQTSRFTLTPAAWCSIARTSMQRR